MSWLGTLIGAADLAVSVSNARQIGKIQEMQQVSQAAEALLAIMRDYIFRANQLKEELLYYRIFRDFFGSDISLSWMGRTDTGTVAA